MIKLIIFDLDGVLFEGKKIHYDALNEALGKNYSISWQDHINKYDGLKTYQKLEILTKEKSLPIDQYEKIWSTKQKFTLDKLTKIKESPTLITLLKTFSLQGYQLVCCTNSVRKTTFTILSKLNITQYFDLILSNEDVKNAKPHPEIYWKAMSAMGYLPEETLIIEDSPYGLLAASRSKAKFMRVNSPKDVTYANIHKHLQYDEIDTVPKWKDDNLNVLIPMAGAGSRFSQAGYTFPKPLIDVRGKPMIQVVIENLNIDAHYIFVVRKDHRQKYHLDRLLHLLTPNCTIVEVDGLTEGAACTALLAKTYINNKKNLLFANSDQYVQWNSNEFFYKMHESNADGGIATFTATHPKWSFAKVNSKGLVTKVAEKNPISNIATVGFYYWKHGSDFVRYAEQMIQKNIRVNNEFYVCPVFNEAIRDGKKIRTFAVEKMWGIGTPEDLTTYLQTSK